VIARKSGQGKIFIWAQEGFDFYMLNRTVSDKDHEGHMPAEAGVRNFRGFVVFSLEFN